MTKQKSLAYIVLIVCMVLLIGSYLQWKEKLSSFHGDAVTSTQTNDNAVENKKSASDGADNSQLKDERERFLSFIQHQDESVQAVFLKRFENHETLQFLIVGSNALEEGNPGYAERLDNALKKTYGEFLQSTIVSYDGTSEQFMNEGLKQEVDLANGYDVILFEPFSLNNNGIVETEDEHALIQQFQHQLVSSVEDAVLILHPPQPVHNARFYPIQVGALQAFAAQNNIPYINHWADWPDSDSDELLDYVTEEGAPNNEGADIWSNALIDYFIAEKMEVE